MPDAPGHRRPTIDDVARAALVSTSAVSFALNDRPGVGPATRARILAVADALGWRPSPRARSLSTSRAGAIGLVLSRDAELLGADPFFAPFIAGIESVLAHRGSALVLQVVPSPAAEAAAYRRLAAEGRVDGIVLIDLGVDDPRPALLAELALPAVTAGRTRGRRGRRPPAVVLDDTGGVTAAVDHLVALGHQRVAHVAGPSRFVHGASRRAAWSAALRAAGLSPGRCVVCDFTAASGAKATQLLFDDHAPPTAIVYANDLMAIAGMSVLASRGLRVPEDVSVTGFDDTELAAHLVPPLTSVRADVVGWGRAAADLLVDLVHDPGGEHLDVDLPPAELVIRGSTSPPPPSGRRPTSAPPKEPR